MTAKTKTAFNLRLPEDVYEKLRLLAYQGHRSINSLLEEIIIKALEKLEK